MAIIDVSIASQSSPVVATTHLEEAIRNGTAYATGTTILDVHSERYLNVGFANPSGSGKNCFFVARKLGGNREEGKRPMAYGFISEPVKPIAAISLACVNLKSGAAASTMDAWYMEDAARIDSSPSTASPAKGFLPNGGGLLNVDEVGAGRIVPPGSSFGFFINGDGYNSDTDKARVVLRWYEEDC